MKLGFIGLGIMGAPMASHLIAAGHTLYVTTRKAPPAFICGSRRGSKAVQPHCWLTSAASAAPCARPMSPASISFLQTSRTAISISN